MQLRRVVVTGMGMLSPVGGTLEESWKNLLAGKSGIGTIDHFDTSDFTVKIAGLVKDFNAEQWGIARKDERKMDLFIQYGIAAGIMAINDSGSEINDQNRDRIGTMIGSGIGGLTLIEKISMVLLLVVHTVSAHSSYHQPLLTWFQVSYLS